MNTETKRNPILPGEAYISEDWFEKEQKEIFAKTWQFAAFEENLAENGSYLTTEVGPHSMIIIRGHDATLRAFHNMCRHRGTQLLRGAGKSGKAITCPYHDWTYNAQGDLISVPEEKDEFPNLDKSCLGLIKGAVGTWRGMIFVHAEETPQQSLDDWFGPVDPYLAPYDPTTLIELPESLQTHHIKANWKIVAENYIDAYHLSHLHSGTLSMYDHTKIESGFIGDHFVFYEPLSNYYSEDLEKHLPYPQIDQSPVEQLGAYVPLLFPGIGLAENESLWSLFLITPISATETRVTIRTKGADASAWQYTKQAIKSASFWEKSIRPKYAKTDSDDPMASANFMAEDIYVCEQQQKAFSSPLFAHGPSAEVGEAAVRQHQKIILDKLTSQ